MHSHGEWLMAPSMCNSMIRAFMQETSLSTLDMQGTYDPNSIMSSLNAIYVKASNKGTPLLFKLQAV